MVCFRPLNMRPDLGDYRGPKGQVWNEVTIHDIDMNPIASPSDAVTAASAKTGKVGGQDRGCYDSWRRHFSFAG